MTPEQFKEEMKRIFPSNNDYDSEEAHGEADDLMVKTLQELGYDLALFEGADIWYA